LQNTIFEVLQTHFSWITLATPTYG